jgi:hypothetical protein
MSSSFLLTALLLALATQSVSAHTCVHDSVQQSVDVTVDEQIYPTEYAGKVDEVDASARKRQTTSPAQGLRVHFDTFNLGANHLDCRQAGQTTVVSRTQVSVVSKGFFFLQKKKKNFFFFFSLSHW